MPDDEKTRDYPVGYGKPPRHARFTKGRSGNPKGRAKGTKNLPTLLMKTLNELVTVTENGQRRMITKLEAMTKQLVNKAASGEPKATQLLLGMIQLIEDRVDPPAQAEAVNEADRQVMEQLFSRIERMKNGGSDENAVEG
jgi:hypothetical protein